MWLHAVCGCEAGLDVLPNSLKRLWRWLMVEKINSRSKIICKALFTIQLLQSSFTGNLVSTTDLYNAET